MTFLVLGGTPYARSLAVRLQETGIPVTYVLFGTDRARSLRPPVDVVLGGLGDVAGMTRHLLDHDVRGVVDATAPFDADVTPDAITATTAAGTPLVRLLPPSWEAQGGSPRWRWADDHPRARQAAQRLGTVRPFLSVGADDLASYLAWADRYVLARVPALPPRPLPDCWEVIRSRGPHSYPAESALLSSRRVDVMVTRDTGGPLGEAKLRVAQELGIFVVMVRRPAVPAGLRVVQSVDAAYAWVARRWRPQDY